MKKSLLFIFVFLLVLSSIQINAQSDPYARDLVVLSKWFEGEFDNDSQTWLEGRRDWPGKEEEKHQRMHATHTKIDAPNMGEHVFYVEEFIDDDPTHVSRQRIVSFVSDPEAKGIRMKLFFLKDQQQYLSSLGNEDLLTKIDASKLFDVAGCDVIFRRQGEQYHGSMESKACQFGEGELRRYSVHDMIVSKNQYWRVDRTFLVSNDQFHKGHPNDEPYKMRRAKYYSCNVSFHEKAYYLKSEKDKHYKDVRIHNQGDMKWFENPNTGKKHGVQLREKEYPFYTEGSDFFMLRFKEEGQLASDVILTAEPGTPSISFQIGWASAQCKLID